MIFETKQQVKPEAKINGKYGMTKLNKDQIGYNSLRMAKE